MKISHFYMIIFTLKRHVLTKWCDGFTLWRVSFKRFSLTNLNKTLSCCFDFERISLCFHLQNVCTTFCTFWFISSSRCNGALETSTTSPIWTGIVQYQEQPESDIFYQVTDLSVKTGSVQIPAEHPAATRHFRDCRKIHHPHFHAVQLWYFLVKY